MKPPEPVIAEDRVNILVVDDRPSNLMSIKGLLEDPVYNLVTASSGEQALDRLLRDEYALILLDVAMPGMDGFETAALIKQREKTRSVPIVFVTASVYDIDHVFRGYKVGAVDYLQKPVDPHALRAKVKVFVELFQQKRQIQRQAERLRQSEARERGLMKRQADAEIFDRERKLGASEARFRNLMESGLLGIFYFSDDGSITEANKAFLEMVGAHEDEVRAGKLNWRELTPADHDHADGRALEELRETGVFRTYEKEFERKDGRRIHVLIGGVSVDDERATGVAFALDVTERKAIEQERSRLVRELRAAVRARDDFLSLAAHELKTPLTPMRLQIQRMARMLDRDLSTIDPEKLAKGVDRVERSCSRLEQLVDRLLDVSRVTVGRLSLEVDDVDLAAVVRDVLDRLRDESERAGCSIHLDAPQPVVGRWDRFRLEQVLENLVGNAVKYGPGKPVHLRVGVVGERGWIEVADQGIGIPAAEQARIFERFERVAPVRHFGGFGLGLWIVRQIVEAHEGTITVHSRQGEGSVFRVELPLRPTLSTESTPMVGAGESSPAADSTAPIDGAEASP